MRPPIERVLPESKEVAAEAEYKVKLIRATALSLNRPLAKSLYSVYFSRMPVCKKLFISEQLSEGHV
jgi:hypothetical protein